jgi:hypothetical protein
MAEEDAGTAPPVAPEGEAALGGSGASPKEPGWYPSRTNPSDQTYWDGQDWTARRRWSGSRGWVVAGDAPEEAVADSSPTAPEPRPSANPYVTAAPRPTATGPRPSNNPYVTAAPRPTATGFTFNVGVFLLLVCGVAVMYGSVGEWVHISGSLGIADFHVSYNGIDSGISTLIGVNGWVTFIGGILLVVFACFEMTSEEQLLGVFTILIAAVTAIFAIFDMFRIVQKISQVPASVSPDVSVGWGLICVLSATVLATLIAIVRLLQR